MIKTLLCLILLIPCFAWAGGVNTIVNPAVVNGVAVPDIVNTVSGLAAAGGGDPEDQFATKPVFSVGITATEIDNEGTITVVSNIATFSVAFPAHVGVGDMVQYDVDNNAAIDAGEYGMIHGITVDRTKAYLLLADGSGVTNTTAPTDVYDIFRAFISLPDWESQTQNTNVDADIDYSISLDLTDGDIGPEYVACYGTDGADTITADITFDGRTTDTDNYVEIFTPVTTAMVGTTQRHDGNWSAGAYNISVGNHAVAGIFLDDNIHFIGIQFIATDSWGVSLLDINTQTGIEMSYCILDGNGNRTRGIFGDGAASFKMWNSSVYDFADAGIMDDWGSGAWLVYNSNIAGNTNEGFDYNGTGGTFHIYNCTSFDNGTDFDGTFDAITTCADDDGDGSVVLDNSNDYENEFTDYSNWDFSIVDAGSGLDEAGTDDPGTGLYSDDITGTARSSTWDIGAHEL